MSFEDNLEDTLKKTVKLKIENKELKRRNREYENNRIYNFERELERELQNRGGSRSEKLKYLREVASLHSLIVSIGLIFFISIPLIQPFHSYLNSTAEIKKAELNLLLHQLEVDRIGSNVIQQLDVDGVLSDVVQHHETTVAEDDHGWMQGLWAFTRDWVFPVVLWIVIASVLFFILLRIGHVSYSYYVAYTSNSSVKGISFISVTASLLGFILTTIRYRHDLFDNPAIEFVLYSTTFCLMFVFFLFAVKSLAAAIVSVFIGVVLLLSVSIMRGGVFVFASEYVEMISNTSVPNGAFLLFATLCPIVFILVICITKVISDKAPKNLSNG